MSTRANVIIKDNHSQQIFYRHSDGYPEGTLPTLNIFMDWLKSGKIRNNVSQACGWLTIIGAMEYNTLPKFVAHTEEILPNYTYSKTDLDSIEPPKDWKCSSYDPALGMAGDAEYVYIIDLVSKTLTYKD